MGRNRTRTNQTNRQQQQQKKKKKKSETNLKIRQSVPQTSGILETKNFVEFQAELSCEGPNNRLYTFDGTLTYKGNKIPIGPNQVLLRVSQFFFLFLFLFLLFYFSFLFFSLSFSFLIFFSFLFFLFSLPWGSFKNINNEGF